MDAFSSDRASLRAQVDFDRRQMLTVSLAAGFAAAVRPVVAATAITTDSKGLIAGEVRIPVSDGEIPAYRAMPDKGGPFPVILVVQEIFGVHEYIRDVCRRLAHEGYMAIAAEMFARQGNVASMTNVQEIISTVVAKVPDAQVMSDLDAVIAYAKASGHGDAERLGITGFCWGGRITWLYAAHNPTARAAVAWYGKLVGEQNVLTPRHPVDVANELKAPVLGLYGEADQGIPLSTVEQMRAACMAAEKSCAIVVYPGAPHAFHADYRPSYRPDVAKAGWSRMLDWFRAHGVT